MKHRFVVALLAGLFLLPAARPARAAAGADTPAPWQREVVYQIYPRSFADSNGDGIGDLGGILSRVDYLHALGVDVVWLNPVYRSPQVDSGYDVSDYLTIDPAYGTLHDWEALRDALHARHMKLMMDLVLNHTSDQHAWFVQETRVKALQHALTRAVRAAPPAEAERIVTLLADPTAIQDAPATGAAATALRTIQAFLAGDSAAAEASGYPSKLETLAELAKSLAPCASSAHTCPGVERPFDDFYIWRARPNNWTSYFSLPMWHPMAGTGGYYMALFTEHQVDLNWRNPRVRRAMGHIIAVWQQRGVDGLRLDSIGTLYKDPTFPDAPVAEHAATMPGRGLQFFTNMPAVHRYLREIAQSYRPGLRTIGEVAFNRPDAPVEFAGRQRGELNEVFVFDHIAVDCDGSKWRAKPFDPHALAVILAAQQRLIHGRAWLGNYLENHDQLRLSSRFGDPGAYRKQSAKAFATLLMTLEGTPYIYQGQEIGMTDLPESTFPRADTIEDVEARNFYAAQVAQGRPAAEMLHEVATRNRDHVRSAMQWDAGPTAGFTTGTPVPHVNPNAAQINVAEAQRDPDSILAFYQRLIALRRTHPSWVTGAFTHLVPAHPYVFAYSRRAAGESSVVLLNLSGSEQDVQLPAAAATLRVRDTIGNYAERPTLAAAVHLRPWEARVYIGGDAATAAIARAP